MNPRLLFIACGISMTISSALSEDITTIDGKKYEAVTISRVEPDGLVLITDSGITKVPFENLPKEVRKKYDYDPEKADTFKKEIQDSSAILERARREQQAQKKAQEDRLAKAQRVSGSVIQVTKDGLLVNCYSDFMPVVSDMQSVGGGGNIYIPDTGKPPRRNLPVVDGIVLLVGHPKQSSLVDNAHVNVDAYEEGTYSYVNTLGSQRTIKKFFFLEGE